MTTETERITPQSEPSPSARDERSPRRRLGPGVTVAIQVAILVAFLAAWQWLPKIDWLSENVRFLDPLFISSPSATWQQLLDLIQGSNGSPSLWPFARSTIEASLIGTAIGTLLGAGAGLVLSNSPGASAVLKPFIIALNAVPRIALIPIIVILFGPTSTSSIVTAITVVFFVVFFNAFEGGRTVAPHVLENARILGASSGQLMFRVRFPYVLAWTVTALPNAVSFGLVSVVTAEILTGTIGMGRLLLDSVTTVQAALTFAVVIVLSVLGLVLVGLTEMLQRRWLHWWTQGR